MSDGLRLAFGLLLFSLLGVAWAAPCDPLPEGVAELAVEGVGAVYFVTLEAALAEGRLELSGGVCVAGESGWVLRSERLLVGDLETAPRFEAVAVEMRVEAWDLEADRVSLEAGELRFTTLVFRQGTLSGEAERGRYDPQEGDLELEAVSVQGRGFRATSEGARLSDEGLLFVDAEATTCLCSEAALYVLHAPSVRYDLSRQRVAIEDGELVIGSLRVALDDVELDPQNLAALSFPVQVEYVTDDPATNRGGTGLGIRLSSLPVDDRLKLEVGVTGLDQDYPFGVVLVAHYRDEQVSFDVGKAALGVQADVSVRQPLAPWLTARFEVRNRHWEAADYLHEGSFGLEAKESLSVVAGDRLSLTQGVFAAASAQTVAEEPILGTRLGLYAEAVYAAPPTPLGRFGVTLRPAVTFYPEPSRTQRGLYLKPTWALTVGALTLSAQYEAQLTNSASPFTPALDRLSPRSLFALNARVALALAPDLEGDFAFAFGYDFLDPRPNGSAFEGVSALSFDAELSWREEGFLLEPYLRAEFAPLLNADLRDNRDAFLEAGLELGAERWTVGLNTRFDLLEPDPLEKLETTVTFPIDLSAAVSLQPFLAFDFAPLLKADEFPRVSGHGLEVTWRTDCGTLLVGYKQYENTFSTSFALRFEEAE